MATDRQDFLTQVIDYHERTKHHLHAYARSLGYLDWATQPNPFRRFAGTPCLPLEHPPLTDEPNYDAIFTPGRLRPRPVNRATISQLFYDSLALSAWKQAGGSRWSLRVNPSSGDLHPTEGYLLAGPVPELSAEPGVYHYSPFEHALEQRWRLTEEEWEALAAQLPQNAVLVGLASIYWRESWKYGERAFRYCHHDVGHAIGALTLAAAVLDWRVRMVTSVADGDLARVLGVAQQHGMEAEHPDCLLAVFPAVESPPAISLQLPPALLDRLMGMTPLGKENRLSSEHHAWPVIDEVATATHFDGFSIVHESALGTDDRTVVLAEPAEHPRAARRLIRQRRSAIAMDGNTVIGREVFYRLLTRVTPYLNPLPFQVLPWRPRVALVLFVHRVEGLKPGLYLLLRDPAQRTALQATLRSEFLWRKSPACPAALELYLLQAGDFRETAQLISCQQDIAADSAFSLGMLTEFEWSLREHGPWFYPRLFWETGLIGQLLYLEAEAAGVRGTGIGCFFDDAMHRLLGIADRSWQSLYHFTIGGAVEDTRLKTMHPYFHLAKENP
ncbi:MAG: SagB/ThcOx family dehydrogenase [Candidatus Competibacteraceae bacterium]